MEVFVLQIGNEPGRNENSIFMENREEDGVGLFAYGTFLFTKFRFHQLLKKLILVRFRNCPAEDREAFDASRV